MGSSDTKGAQESARDCCLAQRGLVLLPMARSRRGLKDYYERIEDSDAVSEP
jgi:hypothetical protein